MWKFPSVILASSHWWTSMNLSNPFNINKTMQCSSPSGMNGWISHLRSHSGESNITLLSRILSFIQPLVTKLKLINQWEIVTYVYTWFTIQWHISHHFLAVWRPRQGNTNPINTNNPCLRCPAEHNGIFFQVNTEKSQSWNKKLPANHAGWRHKDYIHK